MTPKEKALCRNAREIPIAVNADLPIKRRRKRMTLEKANPITVRPNPTLEPAGNPGSRAPVLPWTRAKRVSGPALHARPGNHFDEDDYRVALIPIEIGKDGEPFLSQHSGGVGLILSLTWQEIASRINGHSAHPDHSQAESIVTFGEVRINFLTMEVYRSGQLLTLTAMEFKTLRFFVSNPFRVFSRDELLNEVWGFDNYPCTRTVDNRVLRLRQKLEADPMKPLHFRTVHGVGYKFVP
jgi:DNA-binding winged helix-turn-helix (wHTH) protein